MTLERFVRTGVLFGGFAAATGLLTAAKALGAVGAAAETAAELSGDLLKGDISGAADCAFSRLGSAGRGVASALQGGTEILGEALSGKPAEELFSAKNASAAASLLTLGAAVDIGSGLLGGSGAESAPLPDLSALPSDAVDDGMFKGDSDDLKTLAEAGELPDTEHVPSDEVPRSEAAKQAFLEQEGYDAQPEGYDIHHIVPLSEGGQDVPENMILLSEDEHDAVTAAHRDFYGWNRH